MDNGHRGRILSHEDFFLDSHRTLELIKACKNQRYEIAITFALLPCTVLLRVSDTVGVYPDPDPTFEK